MRMEASEVGDWLWQIAGKRDHRKLVPEGDYFVLRPGPNFDWLMGNPIPTQPPASAPEPDPAGEDRSKPDDRGERGSSTRT
jgi:hypothetical protein